MPNPNQLSAVAELPSPAGTLPGLAARIGSTIGDAIRSGYESLHNGYETARRNARTYLALGATAFAGAQAAELALNTDPAGSDEGVPALSAEAFDIDSALVPWAVEQHPYMGPGSASASSTKQTCLSKLKQPPYNVSAVMLNPSNSETLIKGSYIDVEGCDSWQRLGRYREQIRQHGRWLDIAGDFWYPTYPNAAHKFALLNYATRGVQEQRVNGHWQPARILFRNEVRSSITGNIVTIGKIKNKSVKIPD